MRKYFKGQLRVYQEGGWVSRHVEVNQGCLMVFSEDRSELQLRLPLRQLNLQPAGLPKTFSLGSCQQLPLAVFKVQGTFLTGDAIDVVPLEVEDLGSWGVGRLSPTIQHGGNELSHYQELTIPAGPSKTKSLQSKGLQESKSLPSQGLQESKSLPSQAFKRVRAYHLMVVKRARAYHPKPGPSIDQDPIIQGPLREQELTVSEPSGYQEPTFPAPSREQEPTVKRARE
uniref:Uncharacterized protein n=1 Tax=Timema tahoe TaxID=61484 RepID=A0A7R9INX4_9NEOP|nr:unnamed protein product [Timema tahoe]